MKTQLRNLSKSIANQLFWPSVQCNLTLALVLLAAVTARSAEPQKTFATPEEALSALATAATAQDSNVLGLIFGPEGPNLASPDRIQAANELTAFTNALNRASSIRRDSDSRCVLEIGEKRWPFPIPLVKKDGRWSFDTEAGKEELLNRRIGNNELATLKVMRACVEAQREYASKDRNGNEVLEYAQRFISTAGTKDGLYWPPDLDGDLSPLGPLVAHAHSLGYGEQPQDSQPSPEPFHGYFFRMLTRQGKHAPVGKYDYIINGHMIAGFGFIAWPASYGETGVMTFIVNQQGRVYEKDLGPHTAKLVEHIKAYDPDPTWNVSPD
jgi:hypothetical protein